MTQQEAQRDTGIRLPGQFKDRNSFRNEVKCDADILGEVGTIAMRHPATVDNGTRRPPTTKRSEAKIAINSTEFQPLDLLQVR